MRTSLPLLLALAAHAPLATCGSAAEVSAIGRSAADASAATDVATADLVAADTSRLDELTALEYDFMDIRVTSSLSGVEVTWLALDTVGLESYEVQRADEYGDWSTIYRLPARRALILLEETFLDPQPVTGMNAYRVARILRDEPPHYSEVRFLSYFGSQGVRLFPNPVSIGQPVYLHFIGPALDEFDLELIDDRGKRLVYEEFTGTGEVEQVSMIVRAPSAGNYVVRMLYEDLPVETWALQVR